MDKKLGTRIYALFAALLAGAGASGAAAAQTLGGIPKSYFEALEEQREKPWTRTAGALGAPQPAPAAAGATVDVQKSPAATVPVYTETSASVPAPVARTPTEEFLRASARGISAGTVEGLAAGFSGGLGLAIVPFAVSAVAAIGRWNGMGSARLQQQSALDE